MGALGTIAPFDKDRPRQRLRQRPRQRLRQRPRQRQIQRQRQVYLAQLAQEPRGQRQTHRGAPEDNCSICLLSLFWKFLHNPLQRLAQEARGQSADPHMNTRERFQRQRQEQRQRQGQLAQMTKESNGTRLNINHHG